VPEQRHLLLQLRGRCDHPVEEPGFHRDRVVAPRTPERFARVDQRVVLHRRGGGARLCRREEHLALSRIRTVGDELRLRRQRRCACEVHERVDGGVHAGTRGARNVVGRPAEAGAPVQMRRLTHAPRTRVGFERAGEVELPLRTIGGDGRSRSS